MDRAVAGQNELEALYSATRKASLGAEQHEKLRAMAVTILARLQQAAEAEKVEGEGSTPPKADAKADAKAEP